MGVFQQLLPSLRTEGYVMGSTFWLVTFETKEDKNITPYSIGHETCAAVIFFLLFVNKLQKKEVYLNEFLLSMSEIPCTNDKVNIVTWASIDKSNYLNEV